MILWLDDDDAIRKLFSTLLVRRGYEVAEASKLLLPSPICVA